MKHPFPIVASLLALAILAVTVQLVRGAVSPTAPRRVWHETVTPRHTRVAIRVSDVDLVPAMLPKGPPEWLRITHELPVSGWETEPCQLDGLGPVLVLRHYLAEKQWASLTTRGGKGPILVRYEIIDAASWMPIPDPESDLSQYRGGPYKLTAILYWADLTADDRPTPLATYVTPKVGSSGESTSARLHGPAMTRVRAQWTEYDLSPKGARWQRLKNGHRVAIGEAGWVINEKSHLAGEGTSQCGWTDSIVPVYDLSISRPEAR